MTTTPSGGIPSVQLSIPTNQSRLVQRTRTPCVSAVATGPWCTPTTSTTSATASWTAVHGTWMSHLRDASAWPCAGGRKSQDWASPPPLRSCRGSTAATRKARLFLCPRHGSKSAHPKPLDLSRMGWERSHFDEGLARWDVGVTLGSTTVPFRNHCASATQIPMPMKSRTYAATVLATFR